MAKKSMIERDRKRIRLSQKYAEKRSLIKKQINEAASMEEKLVLHRQLQQLPRNSAPVRIRNRCSITGRPRGYFKDFGISRHVLREYAHQGLLPGVRKASW
uniref:Small ribosomal subunit protein uS14c n=1 Tax=Pseudochloris wilhelmii TaxID=1418016 RepID=A0A097KQQ8_9CHLO|nr:ribosomal protein S14 [Pseudochloris wilhelmii]AIT95534.1 ribosomal protein S14 [Pseudochloris wilhelmii]